MCPKQRGSVAAARLSWLRLGFAGFSRDSAELMSQADDLFLAEHVSRLKPARASLSRTCNNVIFVFAVSTLGYCTTCTYRTP
jgi:hypothetical protein